MIEERAIVAKVERQSVWVDSRKTSHCGGCRQQQTCATSLLERLLPKRLIEVDCDLELKPGDEVVIGIEEHSLISASLLQYLVPLLLLFITAASLEFSLDASMAQRDLIVAAGALVALATGLTLISRWQRGFLFSYFGRPVVLRKLPATH